MAACDFARVKASGNEVPVLVLTRRLTGGSCAWQDECLGGPLPVELAVVVGEQPWRIERLRITGDDCQPEDKHRTLGAGWSCDSLRSVSLARAPGTGPAALVIEQDSAGGLVSSSGDVRRSYRLLGPGLPTWFVAGNQYFADPGGNCCAWDEPPVETAREVLTGSGACMSFSIEKTIRIAWGLEGTVTRTFTRFEPFPAAGSVAPQSFACGTVFGAAEKPDGGGDARYLGGGRWMTGARELSWHAANDTAVGIETTNSFIPMPIVHLSVRHGGAPATLVVPLDLGALYTDNNAFVTRVDREAQPIWAFSDGPPLPPGMPDAARLARPDNPRYAAFVAAWQMEPPPVCEVSLLTAETIAATPRYLFLVLRFRFFDRLRADYLLVVSSAPGGELHLEKSEMLASNIMMPMDSGKVSWSIANRTLAVVASDATGTAVLQTTYPPICYSEASDDDCRGARPAVQELMTTITPEGRWLPVKATAVEPPEGGEVFAYPTVAPPYFVVKRVPLQGNRP